MPAGDITDDLMAARAALAYWQSQSGPEAAANVKEWGDKVKYLLGTCSPSAQPLPVTTAPTAPVLGSTSVASSVITVPVSTPSTHPDGIGGYQVWRGTSSGGEVYIGNTNTIPYISPALAAGTYYFKLKGIAASGSANVSAFSNEVSAVISGALAADTTPPLTSVLPTLESGGGATLATVVYVVPPADSTVNSATQIVSGGDHVRWYRGGVYVSGADSYYPSRAAETLQDVGLFVTGSGADDGATFTTCNNSSGYGIYSNVDSGFTLHAAPTKGKVTAFIKPTTATSPSYWGKAIGLIVRATNDPASAYLNVFLFASGGAKAIGCEWRDATGAQASQATAIAYTTMPWLKLVYDPDTQVAVTSYSTDSTNGTDGSWTVHTTRSMPAIGKNYLSGKFGSESSTATYLHYSVTVDTKCRLALTGTQQVGGPTIVTIAHDALDKAGNANSIGAALSISYDALADSGGGGGGGGGGNPIGTPGNYPLTSIMAISNGNHSDEPFHSVVRFMDSYIYFPDWNNSSDDADLASIRTDNPNCKAVLYTDCIFQYPGTWRSLTDWATNNNFLLRDSYQNGAIVPVGGGIAPCVNPFDDPPSGSTRITDVNGRTSSEWCAAWLHDLAVNRGAGGIAYDVPGHHFVPDLVYFDDTMAYVQSQGDYTRGAGGDQSAAIQAGTIRRKAIFEAKFGVPCGTNTSWGGNAGQRTVPSAYNGLWALKWMETFEDTCLYNSPGAGMLAAMKNEYKAGDQLTATNGLLILGTKYVRFDGSDPIQANGGVVGQSGPDEGANYWAAIAYTWGRAIAGISGYYYRPQDAIFPRVYSINTTTGLPYSSGSWSSGRGWMGKAVGTGQIDTPQANGTYVREWEHAWVIANIQGNGAQTFTTPVNVRLAIAGTYYAAGSSVPLADRSGTFLVKV